MILWRYYLRCRKPFFENINIFHIFSLAFAAFVATCCSYTQQITVKTALYCQRSSFCAVKLKYSRWKTHFRLEGGKKKHVALPSVLLTSPAPASRCRTWTPAPWARTRAGPAAAAGWPGTVEPPGAAGPSPPPWCSFLLPPPCGPVPSDTLWGRKAFHLTGLLFSLPHHRSPKSRLAPQLQSLTQWNFFWMEAPADTPLSD